MADTANKTLVDGVYTAITAAAESGTIHFNGAGAAQVAEGSSQPAATIRGLILNKNHPNIQYTLAAGQIMYAKPEGSLNCISVTPA